VKLRLKPIRHAQLTTRRFEAKLHWQPVVKPNSLILPLGHLQRSHQSSQRSPVSGQ
jgi:hypothetical protein